MQRPAGITLQLELFLTQPVNPPISPDGKYWWDGGAWQPMPAQTFGPPSPPSPFQQVAPQFQQVAHTRRFYQKKRILVPAGVVALLVVVAVSTGSGSGGSSGSQRSDTSGTAATSSNEEAPSAQAASKAPAKQAKQRQTAGQKNALAAGKNYLSLTAFSHDGLIQQLTAGDGYSSPDATYAADNIGANWNEQAAKAAKNYLEMTSFSRDGLIQQLSVGDKYTPEEATYGVDQAGL